uniref:Uncharacterized protein n=1 Tax=Physcomitrium patens TaxID=3218 RepID=A0A2K1IGU5_PHYPA|nr:hypothetical protein PHYPA_029082 [Physcomitrium patens]
MLHSTDVCLKFFSTANPTVAIGLFLRFKPVNSFRAHDLVHTSAAALNCSCDHL